MNITIDIILGYMRENGFSAEATKVVLGCSLVENLVYSV